MKKPLLLIAAAVIGLAVSQCFAASELSALQERAKELRQQQTQLRKEVKANPSLRPTLTKVETEARSLTHQIRMLQDAGKIEEAVASVEAVAPKSPRKLLVYSRTRGYRHDSIPMGIHVFTRVGQHTGAFSVDATEDPAIFTDEKLAAYDGILMLSTTRDAIPAGEAREAVERFLGKGKGLIGIHGATDCHKDWPAYREAMGGLFDGHPWNAGDTITLYNEEPEHPVCKCVEQGYQLKDEIYQYKDDEYFTREKLRILLSLDLSGPKMKREKMKRADNDYPVSWIRRYQNSRVFYSNLGHNHFTFYDKVALQHFLAGIQFALGDIEADARPSAEVGNGKPKPLPEGF